MKKVSLYFLVVTTVLNAGFGVFGVNYAHAEGYSFTPTSETYSLLAGQAQSFVVNVNTAGVIQALDTLDSQTDCQEKVCVCKYQVEVVTLKLRDDEMIEQIGSTVSDTYDCREIKGGVGPVTVPYGISIAEPGSNYYVNISQVVSTEGASFGASGATQTIGGIEVHQVNVAGKNVVEGPLSDAPSEEETKNVELSDEDSTEVESMEVGEPNEQDWEYFQSGLEFEFSSGEVSVDSLSNMLAEETGGTFTIKLGDGVVLSSVILATIRESGKNLSIRKYQGDQVLYEWKIKNSAINSSRDFDPTVNFVAEERTEIEQALSGLKVTGEASKMYFGTVQEGALPDGTKLKVLVNSDIASSAERLNLYNYDADLGEVEVAYESIKVNGGYAEFAVARGSSGYFLTPAQIVTVSSEEIVAGSESEEQNGMNWLLIGMIGIGGTGILGLAGFWLWKKYSNRGAKADAVVADDETTEFGEMAEDVDEENVMEPVVEEQRSVVMKPVCASLPMVVKSSAPRPVARGGRKVMDMVSRPQVTKSAQTIVGGVTMKGSSKRLVIS